MMSHTTLPTLCYHAFQLVSLSVMLAESWRAKVMVRARGWTPPLPIAASNIHVQHRCTLAVDVKDDFLLLIANVIQNLIMRIV